MLVELIWMSLTLLGVLQISTGNWVIWVMGDSLCCFALSARYGLTGASTAYRYAVAVFRFYIDFCKIKLFRLVFNYIYIYTHAVCGR